MKKLLMTLMATAICALVTTSCVKGPDDIPPSPTPTPTPTPPEPTPEEKYDAAFLSYVGGTISSAQDWGFNASVAATRGMTRGAEKGYFIDDDYDKEYTQNFYDAIFQLLPEGTKVAEGIHKNFEFQSNGPLRFDIIFSYTSIKNIEIGYYHYSPNDTPDKREEVKLVGAFDKDQLTEAYFQFTRMSTPSAKDWITPDAAVGYNMFTMQRAQMVHARFFTLRDGSGGDPVDVPKDDYVGFYVKIDGKKYYTNRYLNENDEDKYFAVLNEDGESRLSGAYVVGIEDLDSSEHDSDCNDLIIAVNKHVEDTYASLIIPEKPVPATWRVIAEDLSAEENTDFDFNDVVLDVTLTKDGADCVLQAAGGQLPLRINGDDDLEVHKMFGVDQKKMVNTINLAKHPELEPYKVDKDSVKFTIKGSFSSVKDVKIEVKKSDGKWHELYAKLGGSACKIVVKPTFKWPDELESLKAVYPKFIDYVKEPTVKWYP